MGIHLLVCFQGIRVNRRNKMKLFLISLAVCLGVSLANPLISGYGESKMDAGDGTSTVAGGDGTSTAAGGDGTSTAAGGDGTPTAAGGDPENSSSSLSASWLFVASVILYNFI